MIADFLDLYYDVVLHSLDYATAYCDVSIVPMAVRFNGETFLSPAVNMDDKFFFSFSTFYNTATK